jgi:pyruvate formate lyase activating enzyme
MEVRCVKECMFYKEVDYGKVECLLCPHNCIISEGKTGVCRVRKNVGGRLISLNYGKISALNLDPIEKKPLRRFMPLTQTLSIGSFGCNMKCPWCQNYNISMETPRTTDMTPQEIVDIALTKKYPSISYTYNEPTVYYEFAYDTARLAKDKGIKNIMVTNGYINEEPLELILPYIDAFNIDLKTYSLKNYKKYCGGGLNEVKNTIKKAATSSHVEITSLMVTGINDDLDDLEEMCKWLASVNAKIPMHLSRYFPMYKYHEPETKASLLYDAEKIAKKYLEYVYLGNIK